MYRLSARQILLIALISGLFAAGGVVLFDRFSKRDEASQAALSEAPPAGIADPSTVTDEQNNIEVYRALSPGVVFIQSTSYARDFFGFVEPQQGSGSGSILDQQGNILTNYHVITDREHLLSDNELVRVAHRNDSQWASRFFSQTNDREIRVGIATNHNGGNRRSVNCY